MAYRDELEAARHQIRLLEDRVQEVQREGQQREQTLLARVASLEAQLGRVRLTAARLWPLCYLPPIVVGLLYAAAVTAAMQDRDGLAWGLAQASIVAGVLGTAWSWGREGSALPLASFAALKLALVVGWGWGWWHPLYRGIAHPSHGTSLYFFWCAPLVVLALVVAEGLLIRRRLRPLLARSRGGPTSAAAR